MIGFEKKYQFVSVLNRIGQSKTGLSKTLAFGLLNLACLFCFFACPVSLAAQGLGKTQVQLVDGSSFSASITSVDQQGKITGDGVPQDANIKDVLSIRSDRSVSENENSGIKVVPAGAGELNVNRIEIANESVKVRSDIVGEKEFSLQAIRAVVWSSSEIVNKAIATPSKDNDKVIVAVADGERVVEGILESLDSEFVTLNYRGESRKIGIAKVKAIVIADLGLKNPEGPPATVRLIDGSSISGAFRQLTEGKVSIALAGKANIEVAAAKIVSINIISDRLMFLSDTEPTEVQEKALFAIQLPWQKDFSVEKNPLRLRGPTHSKTLEFKKGLGVQSFSQLTFSNTREYDRFAATIGIDVETGGRGDCRMTVQGDGIELWSKRVKATDQAEAIEVDITGMKEITLTVHPDEDFDLGDHADWAEARFVKTK